MDQYLTLSGFHTAPFVIQKKCSYHAFELELPHLRYALIIVNFVFDLLAPVSDSDSDFVHQRHLILTRSFWWHSRFGSLRKQPIRHFVVIKPSLAPQVLGD